MCLCVLAKADVDASMDVYSGVCVSMLVRIFLDVGEIMCICMEGKHCICKEPQIQPPCRETEENIIS